MNPGALKSLEFDRIVAVVSGLAVTPTGADRLAALQPATEAPAVIAAQRATTEGVRFLADHAGFPLRAPADLNAILEALAVEGRPLEPLRLLGLADYLESIAHARTSIRNAGPAYPILAALAGQIVSFAGEVADVRRKIEPSGNVADGASPRLAGIRERLRRQKQRLRATMESFIRNRDTAKYLQEQVVTDRNGRHVLMVRAEHRMAIPGIVHGGSSSGASLFVEPLETVEINNEIVALEEEEHEEVRRILLALTDAFRGRPADLARTVELATELDAIQARARFSLMVDGVEPVIAADGTVDLTGARHPLLIRSVSERVAALSRGDEHDGEQRGGANPDPRIPASESRPPNPESRIPNPGSRLPNPESRSDSPVPVDIRLVPPVRVLVITGPNTGGKTVALKTLGLLAAMAQAGLHVPAEPGSRLPVFRSIFADIGDEQSIAASLSTFSAHIANVVSMDRHLALPALILLDEVGAGTDPVEGGALGMAVIDHFRRRGAHVVATTHYDSLKSYASTTEGVEGAAFGFDPHTFAPTYRLVYGSPGRSLAIEIAARLGMPASVITAARENLGEGEKQLAAHLARVDEDLRKLDEERRAAARERARVAETERSLRAREQAVRDREAALRRRLDARIDEHLREARREIDAVVEGLKARAAELSEQAAVRLRSGDRLRAAGLSTGETGAARAEARAALDAIGTRVKAGLAPGAPPGMEPQAPIEPGTRVAVGGLGLEGTVVGLHGGQAEIDVRGKRLRAAVRDLRPAGTPDRGAPGRSGGSPAHASVRVNVDLQPRERPASELNVIGATVDEALARVEKFLDECTVTDLRTVRIVHGHGTGQLRRAIAAFLEEHPLVAGFGPAPQNQGGAGATVVELKD